MVTIRAMNTISISELKINPTNAINQAADYPVAIQSRNTTRAYLIGKELYEKLLSFVEDLVDQTAVSDTDFAKGKDFEKVAKELGI